MNNLFRFLFWLCFVAVITIAVICMAFAGIVLFAHDSPVLCKMLIVFGFYFLVLGSWWEIQKTRP